MADDSEAVGYRRPPKHSRFQRGRSGNPSGRPKGARGFAAELREELCEVIEIGDGPAVLRITKQRAVIKRLVASAIEGDLRALAIVVSFCARGERDHDEPEQAPEDAEILQAIGGKPTPGRSRARASGAQQTEEPDE